MRPEHDFPGIRTTERAVCDLCGEEITTVNGGRRTGSGFVSFEGLLDLHMEEQHPNLCVLPAVSEQRIAA
jgi:hypothetical protein